ncbi:MAG: serine hydrolase [Thalassobaculaceae bacterium]
MTDYVPGAGDDWARIEAAEAGADAAALDDARSFAVEHESKMNRDIAKALEGGHFSEPPPLGDIIGPTAPRGPASGIVLRGGKILAEWGPTDRADITFSVTKSYLSIMAGLAVDDGLIPDVHQPVGDLVDDGGFDAAQNRTCTWHHFLQNTSEWEGTLFSKPDLVDRNRDLSLPPGTPSKKGTHRDLAAPGDFWEYNDVRVNRLSLSLLRVHRKPLPKVLKTRIMDPIGASDTWSWNGYINSWVEVDGQPMPSVSGGAHWGGGLFISARDHARVGLLMLRRGMWGDVPLLSPDWVDACTTPCALNPSYGYLWWLNGDGRHVPSAPRTSFFAMGVGSNVIWIDPVHDLVCVLRWIDKPSLDGFAKRLMKAIG